MMHRTITLFMDDDQNQRTGNPLMKNLAKQAATGLVWIGLQIAVGQSALAKEPEFAPTGLVQTVFENGLEVVVIPDRRAPVVTHMVWYKVGAADDPVGKSGLAHFLEHLMFKGTSTAPAGEFSTKIAEIGGRENAFTSVDYTAYYQKISPDALEMVMRYEADRMSNLVLTEDVIEPEKNVVLEERRSRVDSNPAAILGEITEATLYKHHPYGVPVIGWEHEIRQLTLEDALQFYRRFYAPNNAILIVAGDVEVEDVLRMAREAYGSLRPNEALQARQRTVEPEPVAARSVEYEDPRVNVPSWQRYFLAPSYRTAAPREAEALDLLATVLGGSSTSRMYRKLVIEEKLATSAGAWFRGTALDRSQFALYGSPRPGVEVAELENAVERVVADILENGVSQEELDRARNNLLKTVIFERDSQTTMARIYGTVLTTGGSLTDIHEWPERIRTVTVEDVNSAARKVLSKPRSVTAYLRPQS